MAGYPATPLLARLAPANGWRHDLVGEDRLNLPAALSESRMVWQRHGSRAEVLAALVELP